MPHKIVVAWERSRGADEAMVAGAHPNRPCPRGLMRGEPTPFLIPVVEVSDPDADRYTLLEPNEIPFFFLGSRRITRQVQDAPWTYPLRLQARPPLPPYSRGGLPISLPRR